MEINCENKIKIEKIISDLKLDGTFNDSSFDREYECIWLKGAEKKRIF